jgi:ribosomal protein L10
MELADLRDTFKGVRDLVVLSVNKLDSAATYNLRKAMRGKNVRLKVVKNSLVRHVFKEMDMSIPDKSDYWKGPSMFAWGGSSIKDLSKTIEEELLFSKGAAGYKETVKIKGAIADGQPVAFAEALKLPTRLDLIGEIIGGLLAPASQIAGCLTGPAGAVASQIEKISEKKEEGAPAA